MQEPTSIFSARLRELRKSMHLTQEDIANTLNIHRTTYTKYETGKANPDQKCLLQLAELFHVSVDHLLGRDPEPSPLCLQDGSASLTLTPAEQGLLFNFRLLTPDEQKTVVEFVYGVKQHHHPF